MTGINPVFFRVSGVSLAICTQGAHKHGTQVTHKHGGFLRIQRLEALKSISLPFFLCCTAQAAQAFQASVCIV